jgi:hypothetical protein
MAHIVNLLGGTGNQLFQYLFGETVRALTGREVVYDAHDFKSYVLHGGFSLTKVLDLSLPTVGDDRASWLSYRYAKRLLAEAPAPVRRLMNFRTDQDFSFATIDRLERDQYFYGFWQGIDYPAATVAGIIDRFRFRPEVVEAAQTTIACRDIDPTADIAIHVRLGDYLKLPRSPHLPLAPDFYVRAVAALRQDGATGQVFVFSDDIKLCRRMLADEGAWQYIEGQSASADLCLMSTMRNKVISASTFGWWAGALTMQQLPRIVYPQPWVKSGFVHHAHLSPPALAGWWPLTSSEARP